MSKDEVQEQIIREISALDEWTDVYQYLIKLGKNLEIPDEGFRREENLVAGCQSNLWLGSELKKGLVIYRAYSEAVITRGMLRLILRVLNNRKPEDIVNADLYFITRTGLDTHLSPTRSEGLSAMIKRMKEQAGKYAGTNQ